MNRVKWACFSRLFYHRFGPLRECHASSTIVRGPRTFFRIFGSACLSACVQDVLLACYHFFTRLLAQDYQYFDVDCLWRNQRRPLFVRQISALFGGTEGRLVDPREAVLFALFLRWGTDQPMHLKNDRIDHHPRYSPWTKTPPQAEGGKGVYHHVTLSGFSYESHLRRSLSSCCIIGIFS